MNHSGFNNRSPDKQRGGLPAVAYHTVPFNARARRAALCLIRLFAELHAPCLVTVCVLWSSVCSNPGSTAASMQPVTSASRKPEFHSYVVSPGRVL